MGSSSSCPGYFWPLRSSDLPYLPSPPGMLWEKVGLGAREAVGSSRVGKLLVRVSSMARAMPSCGWRSSQVLLRAAGAK